jgi:hypothetical protein
MELIEEQWNPPSSLDIMSDLWMNMSDVKKAIKIWILDRGESWGVPTQNNKTRLQLPCILFNLLLLSSNCTKEGLIWSYFIYSTQLPSFDLCTV